MSKWHPHTSTRLLPPVRMTELGQQVPASTAAIVAHGADTAWATMSTTEVTTWQPSSSVHRGAASALESLPEEGGQFRSAWPLLLSPKSAYPAFTKWMPSSAVTWRKSDAGVSSADAWCGAAGVEENHLQQDALLECCGIGWSQIATCNCNYCPMHWYSDLDLNNSKQKGNGEVGG